MLDVAERHEIGGIRRVQPLFGIGDALLHRGHLAFGRLQRLLQRAQFLVAETGSRNSCLFGRRSRGRLFAG